MEIPRNEFACKFQVTLQMGQKVIIGFWWESGFCIQQPSHHFLQTLRPLRLFSAIGHFIETTVFILSAIADQRMH